MGFPMVNGIALVDCNNVYGSIIKIMKVLFTN